MYIDGTNEIILRRDGAIIVKIDGNMYYITTDCGQEKYEELKDVYNMLYTTAPTMRAELFEKELRTKIYSLIESDNATSLDEAVKVSAEEILQKVINKMMAFFSEFHFDMSFRFLNTLAYACKKSQDDAIAYVKNYFALMDSPDSAEINEKMKSAEFKDILAGLSKCDEPKKRINNRLIVYYGARGTGKTTTAMPECDNRCILCNSTITPADLMEDFVFKDGKPDFNPSLLWECMEQGLPVVMDEINLLPFETVRFLQGVLDGKKEFSYKNRVVHINDGFKIIGTMNLSIGGMTYGLPEPLVDRCEEIREFTLTAEQLMKAITE